MDPLAHVPGAGAPPVVGHSLQFLRDCHRLMDSRRARYGDVFRTELLGRTVVVFLTPQATREIYLDPDQVLSSEGGWSTSIGPLFRRGLMLRDFDDHRVHRQVMRQAFSRTAISGYVEAIHSITDRHLDALPPGEFDVYLLMKRLTLDVAAEVFVGASLGEQAGAVNRGFVDAMGAALTPFRFRVPGTAFHRGMRGRESLQRVFRDLVVQRRKEEPRPDLLSRLSHATTESGTVLDVDEVVDHMIFLMLAAHDTTTSTLAVLLWQLALHPDRQDRVVEEVQALGGEPVTLANHASLVQTRRAMQESLRLSPPVPFSPRVATRDVVIDGVPIPAGVALTPASMTLHRHPDWWSDPLRFDPDRFAPGRAEHAQHSHLFVPFGGGAHLCIGNHVAELVVTTVVARLLATRRLVADPGAGVIMQPVPIPRPRGAMVLTVT
ncbi:cytochrome P450 [Aquipuribacter sp. MA13-6]|uniref:cytochrome P450 n=1 Tax=unclassified Aquipuribacter TaxID=2635084 RepID=UPI003EED6FBC